MRAIGDVLLRDAKPDDRAHLLLWDTPNEPDLQHLLFYNNAHRVNYRENLLGRINPTEESLGLDNIDRELEAIRSMCVGVDKDILLLEGLDCLITYLNVQASSKTPLFWKNLENTRNLEKVLWILLPHKLAPENWPENRIKLLE